MALRHATFLLSIALAFAAPGNTSVPALLRNPYSPDPIVDPSSDISCDDFACNGKRTCTEWPLRLCRKYQSCDEDVCLHKALWPLLPQDVLLFVAMFVVSFLAGAPGIGGGGINVPMLMILSQFDIKEAVPLSHIAVMGNAMSQLAMNTPKRHPLAPQRPLIHYEIAALLLPAMLGGNSLGVVVGRVFPQPVLIILSLVLLTLTSVKTFIKGYHLQQEHRQQARSPLLKPPPQQNLVNADPVQQDPVQQDPRVDAADPAPQDQSEQPRMSSIRQWPQVGESVPRVPGMVRSWSGTFFPQAGTAPQALLGGLGAAVTRQRRVPVRIPWRVISFMFLFNLLFCADFLMMSPEVSGVKKCTPAYWILLVGLYPVVGASVFIGVNMLRALAKWHEDRGDVPIPGDPVVNGVTVIVYPGLAVIVGLMAGLLGLGGGEFLVPLLLEFGVHSRVAAATSGFLIFFNTSSNIVHYFLTGTIEPFLGYGVGCFFVAMIGSWCGLLVGNTKFVQEHSYLIIYLVAALLASSEVLLAWRGFLFPMNWSFGSICHS